MGAIEFLLYFLTFLYFAFLVIPFLVLGILSLIRYFRYREVWNGEARARQCKRDAIIFFAIAAVSLGLFVYFTWNDWMSMGYQFF